MASQASQDSLDALLPPPQVSMPATPEIPHATIARNAAPSNTMDTSRIDLAASDMTPPPSTQIPSSQQRGKTRTPTPPVSHISTPPPTIELPGASQISRIGGFAAPISQDHLKTATADELRSKVGELHAALQEAKMSAAHHKLQYRMLSQESAAAMERMAVEARMTQMENEVVQSAEQARVAATPMPQYDQGVIPIQKELYQNMCREIHFLKEANHHLELEGRDRERVIAHQEDQIASLSDKVTLMVERIRHNREQLQKYRRPQLSSRLDQTPRSVYHTPQRGHNPIMHRPQPQLPQQQPFAALLQASEMASQESARAGKKGHSRNTHSMSSLPSTPQRSQRIQQQTPQGRQSALKVPSTAPVPRTSALRTPDIYSQAALPVTHQQGPPSDGTVSASDDNDSEAETDIIEQDDYPVNESRASLTASHMLRTSQEDIDAKRDSFKGRGMLEPTSKSTSAKSTSGSGDRYRQTKLFGAVRKAHVDREPDVGGRPSKRARTSPGSSSAVGLGISTRE